MRSLIVSDRGPVSVDRLHPQESPCRELLPQEVRIRVSACAMCRTDLQIASGDIATHKDPIVPGHQIVGRIVEVGSAVPTERVGQRVGVAWLAYACGECRFCCEARENLCLAAQFTGWDVDGGYADHAIADARFTFDLAAFGDRSDDSIAPLLCAGVIGYRSLRIAGIDSVHNGSYLGLYGYGASARQVLQIARHWGIDVHVAARTEADRAQALNDGANSAGLYSDPPPVPLHSAITFAPVWSVVDDAVRAVDRGGVVAINAIHLDEKPGFTYENLWWEKSLRSVANVTSRDIRDYLALAAELDLRAPYELLPLGEANEGLRRMEAGDVTGSFVLIP